MKILTRARRWWHDHFHERYELGVIHYSGWPDYLDCPWCWQRRLTGVT